MEGFTNIRGNPWGKKIVIRLNISYDHREQSLSTEQVGGRLDGYTKKELTLWINIIIRKQSKKQAHHVSSNTQNLHYRTTEK